METFAVKSVDWRYRGRAVIQNDFAIMGWMMIKTANHIKSFVLAAVVLAFSMQKGNGFLLVLFLPFILIYLIHNAVRMAIRPAERKSRGIRLMIWLVVPVLSVAVHIYWSASTRSNADLALQKVMTYKERVGIYPASLKDAGLDDEMLRKKWRIRYSIKEGRPSLTFPEPIMPLSLYEYDFETLEWKENIY